MSLAGGCMSFAWIAIVTKAKQTANMSPLPVGEGEGVLTF